MVTFIDCIFFLMASMAADVECQASSGENDYDRSRSKIQAQGLRSTSSKSSSSVVSKWKIEIFIIVLWTTLKLLNLSSLKRFCCCQVWVWGVKLFSQFRCNNLHLAINDINIEFLFFARCIQCTRHKQCLRHIQ